MFQPKTSHLPLAQDNTVFAEFLPQAWFSLGNPCKRPIVKDLVLTTFSNLRIRKDLLLLRFPFPKIPKRSGVYVELSC